MESSWASSAGSRSRGRGAVFPLTCPRTCVAVPVDGREAVGGLGDQGGRLVWVEAAAGEAFGERFAGDVGHDDKRLVALFAGVVDGAHVGVIDGRGAAGLAQEALPGLLPARRRAA